MGWITAGSQAPFWDIGAEGEGLQTQLPRAHSLQSSGPASQNTGRPHRKPE